MDFWRQIDIVPLDKLQDTQVTIIGVGGIGSPTALALAKMGVGHLIIFDGDTVTNHNLPNQLYRTSDLGKNKVDALAEILAEFSQTEVVSIAEFFERQSVRGIVISGVDSMATRKKILEAIRMKPSITHYIEARMGGQSGMIYTINPCLSADLRAYETTLYSDEAAQELPCTQRAIMYNVFVIAGLIGNQVKRIVCSEPLDQEIIVDLAGMNFLTNQKILPLKRV